LTGGAEERVIMRMIGSFWRASMVRPAACKGELEGEAGVRCGRVRTPEARSAGGEAFSSVVDRGVSRH
jgi:hypothetical protein